MLYGVLCRGLVLYCMTCQPAEFLHAKDYVSVCLLTKLCIWVSDDKRGYVRNRKNMFHQNCKTGFNMTAIAAILDIGSLRKYGQYHPVTIPAKFQPHPKGGI